MRSWWDRDDPRWLRSAAVLWCVFLITILVVTIVTNAIGHLRSVVPTYREASLAWVRGETLYQHGTMGFLYAPQAAAAFVPFGILPPLACELAWRVVSISAFALAVWRIATVADSAARRPMYLLMSALCIGPIAGAASNGQSNLVMSALMAFACVALAERRWWLATLWIALAVAIKPLAVAMAVVAFVTHPKAMAPRLVLAAAVVALLPFAAQHPEYVAAQYQAFFVKMRASSNVKTEEWADLAGMFRAAGIEPHAGAMLAARVVLAVLMCGVAALAALRWPAGRAAVVALACASLMVTVLNPRCESNTYGVLAPAMTAVLAWVFVRDRRRALALFLFLTIIVMSFAREIFGSSQFAKPGAAMVFAIVVAALVLRDVSRKAEVSRDPLPPRAS